MSQARSVTLAAPDAAPAVPVSRPLAWFAEGLRLGRRSPGLLLALGLAPFVVEGLLQLVPLVGMLLSKLLPILVMGGQYVAVDRLARGGHARLVDLLLGLRGGRPAKLVTLGALSLIVFATQVLVAWSVYGGAVIDQVVLGRFRSHPELMKLPFLLTLVLPGLVPGMLLAFALPLVMLAGRGPVGAAVESARRVAESPGAFALFLVMQAALLGGCLALPVAGVVLLVPASVWSLTTTYAAYRELFAAEEHAAPASG